jgi:hypothetical protein
MRNLQRQIAAVLTVVGLACSGGFVGCGVDETTHSLAVQGPLPPPPADDGRLSSETDDVVTAVDIEASFGYDSDTDRGLAYFAFRDQDGGTLWDFTNADTPGDFELAATNFSITLFPSVAPDRLDPLDFEIGTQFRDNKVIALVIDVSGSMGWAVDSGEDPAEGEPSRLDVAKDAAKAFLEQMLPDGTEDLVALVTFSTDASTLTALTSDRELLKARIDALETEGATNFGAGIAETVNAVGVQPGKRTVVFLTDGVDTVDTSFDSWPAWQDGDDSLRWEAMQELIDYELVVYTIAFGPVANDADAAADLRAFAGDQSLTTPPPNTLQSGAYYPALTVGDLTDAFSTEIPAGIEALSGTTSPFVSFPNDYPDQAGPIETAITVWYENLNGTHFDSTRGTFIVP